MRKIWNKGHRIRASDKNLGRLGSSYGKCVSHIKAVKLAIHRTMHRMKNPKNKFRD
mgnify:FL=1